MIRQAKLLEIPEILEVTKVCAAYLIEKNIFQWNEHYPSVDAFENDVRRNELFVFDYNGKIIGGVVVSTDMDDEYKSIEWLTKSGNNIYIHRLFVHPKFQGKGYAQQLMDFAEEFAQKNNYDSVRLDTFSQNERNQLFYEQRGYQRLGDIFFPKQSAHPFHCYELVFDSK